MLYLIELAIMKLDSNIKFIYALDNIDYDENGKVIDKAFRLAYFKVVNRMSEYCYNKRLCCKASEAATLLQHSLL